jgi:hypothetical protein
MKKILIGLLAMSSLSAIAQTGLVTADCGNVQKVRYSPNLLNRLIVKMINVESLTYAGGALQTSETKEKIQIKLKGSNELQILNIIFLNSAAQGAKQIGGILCVAQKFNGSDFIHISGIGKTKDEALEMLLEDY